MPSESLRLPRFYLWVVGAGLLAQGVLTVTILMISDEGARRTHGILNHDTRHGLLHVIWGLALVLLAYRERRRQRLIVGAIVFGVFYLALGVLGIVTHHPFGLVLGAGENGFHLIVGSSALAAAGLAIRDSANLTTFAPSAELNNR